jgi:hypothetical protein
MRFFLLILLLGLIFAPHARAQQGIFPIEPQSPLELLEPQMALKTLPEFANAYYLNCQKANTDERLKPYVSTQCACASAGMMQSFSRDQASRLLDPQNRDSYYYARLMILAYVPCLQISVHDFVFDDCMAGTPKNELPAKYQVCECLANGLARAASGPNAAVYIPGYGSNFKLSETVANPFPYVISSEGLQNVSQAYIPACADQELYRR